MAFLIHGKLFRLSQNSCVKTVVKNFGSNLKWETNLEAGLQNVVARQKPGMIVFHKSWCGACRQLKPKFEASKEIEKMSEQFVMISLADDNVPKDMKYMPDGDYVPRILFVNPQGNVMLDAINEGGSSEYKYFYSDAESIARSMKSVLKRHTVRVWNRSGLLFRLPYTDLLPFKATINKEKCRSLFTFKILVRIMKCETSLKSGIKKLKELNRPGMVIIHKSTCHACISLKGKFLASREIDRLSNDFIVISLVDSSEPMDEKWWVDGRYFPRIFFLDPNGHIMKEVTSTDSKSRFKYYYNSEKSLLQSMERVLQSFSKMGTSASGTEGQNPNVKIKKNQQKMKSILRTGDDDKTMKAP